MENHTKKPRKTNNSSIARMRIAKGLTQAQLAEMVGCLGKDISRWEKGMFAPNARSLKALAHALGCNIEDLIEK